MKIVKLITAFSGCVMMLAACVGNATFVPARRPIPNQKVYIYAPIRNDAGLASLDSWPPDSGSRVLLREYFAELQRRITGEMRRCEKYGYYAIIDDSAGATVRMRCALLSARLQGDTVEIPFTIQLIFAGKKETLNDTIYSRGIYKPKSPAEKPLYYWGYILSDYVRNFPYRRLGELFYAHKNEPE
ncbi:MAG: hypothetical protein PHC61_08850 [Chitinivibrionales bacterium]|nr:hypothetical protein [Chitinivibrionales bacterium]